MTIDGGDGGGGGGDDSGRPSPGEWDWLGGPWAWLKWAVVVGAEVGAFVLSCRELADSLPRAVATQRRVEEAAPPVAAGGGGGGSAGGRGGRGGVAGRDGGDPDDVAALLGRLVQGADVGETLGGWLVEGILGTAAVLGVGPLAPQRARGRQAAVTVAPGVSVRGGG